MAASDPQRQLLTLIRDFASEKSQGGTHYSHSPHFRLVAEKTKEKSKLHVFFCFLFINAIELVSRRDLWYAERRIVGLKKRIQELRSEVDAANVELEDAKCLKEITEQEIKGYEVELAMNEASIQTLEVSFSRIHVINALLSM